MPTFESDMGGLKITQAKCFGLPSWNSRFYLDLTFDSGSETAVVIMMNPSSTAKQYVFSHVPLKETQDVDATTRNVIKRLSLNGIDFATSLGKTPGMKFSRIIFLNLIPYYSSKTYELNKIYFDRVHSHESYSLNLTIIGQIFGQFPTAHYFCGWTKKSKHFDFAIEDVRQLMVAAKLQNVFYYDISQKVFNKLNINSPIAHKIPHASKWA